MELVKKTKDYSIFKKRNARFAVKSPRGKAINGEKKAEILISEKLITVSLAKKAPEVAEEAPVEAAAEETTQAVAEATEEKAE